MSGKRSRAKGKRGQSEFARLAEEAGFDAIDMGNLQASSTTKVPDVTVDDIAIVEVKRREKFSIYPTLEQAVEAYEGYRLRKPCAFPAIAHRRNRKEWVVILRLDDFWKLLRAYAQCGC